MSVKKQRMAYAAFLIDNNKPKMAKQLLISHCKEDHPKSLMLMGRVHESQNNYDDAFRCYSNSYNHGFYPAAIPLAKCYLNGTGVDYHVVEAVRILESALDHVTDAYFELGLIYVKYKSSKCDSIFRQGKRKGCVKCKQYLKKQQQRRPSLNKLFNILCQAFGTS